MMKGWLIFVLFLRLSVGVSAALWFVSTTGSTKGTGSEEDPFKTIEEAVNASSDGDTIVVEKGNYDANGNSDLDIDKSLSFQGEVGTTIDFSAGSARFATVSNNAFFRLDSFILKKSATVATNGSVLTVDVGSFWISNCFFEEADVPNVLNLNKASGTITHTSFLRNQGPLLLYRSQVYFYDSSFSENFGLNGGAIIINNNFEPVLFQTCSFTSNRVDSDGGAIYVESSLPDSHDTIAFTASDLTCVNNTAENGGCIFSRRPVSIKSSHFEDNQATKQGSNGGAISLSLSSLSGESSEVSNSSFVGNSARGQGGALYVTRFEADVLERSFGGRSVELWNFTEALQILECVFTNNTSVNGGAFCFENSSASATVILSQFDSNQADIEGGAIISMNSQAELKASHCTFDSNLAKQRGGGASVADGLWQNCTFSGNVATFGAFVATRDVYLGDSSFNGNPSGGVNVVQGGVCNIDKSDLSQNSKIGGPIDLVVWEQASAFISDISYVSSVLVNGTLIFTGDSLASTVDTLVLGQTASLQLNSNLTISAEWYIEADSIQINKTQESVHTEDNFWLINKGYTKSKTNGVTISWNQINFLNKNSIVISSGTNMIFSSLGEFVNEGRMTGDSNIEITVPNLSNSGTFSVSGGNGSTPFLITGNLTCKSKGELEFVADSGVMILHVTETAHLAGLARFVSNRKWQGTVMEWENRIGKFHHHEADNRHSDVQYYPNFLEVTIGGGKGNIGGWVVGGTVMLLCFLGAAMVFYKYREYKKNQKRIQEKSSLFKPNKEDE